MTVLPFRELLVIAVLALMTVLFGPSWPRGPGALPGNYGTMAPPDVKPQLEKAGGRLTAVPKAALN